MHINLNMKHCSSLKNSQIWPDKKSFFNSRAWPSKASKLICCWSAVRCCSTEQFVQKSNGEIQKGTKQSYIHCNSDVYESKKLELSWYFYWMSFWLWLKDGGRGGKSKASILQMMKPPYNTLQDVKVLGVKFMSAWPPLAEMMGLFTAMPSVWR